MSIVFDFDDIARRVGRKPDVALEPMPEVAVYERPDAEAAIRTLKALGYIYEHGAQMWKPPLVTQRPATTKDRLEAAVRSHYQEQVRPAPLCGGIGGIGGVILENADALNMINQQRALGQQEPPSMRERFEAAMQAQRDHDAWANMKRHLLGQLSNQSGGWID